MALLRRRPEYFDIDARDIRIYPDSGYTEYTMQKFAIKAYMDYQNTIVRAGPSRLGGGLATKKPMNYQIGDIIHWPNSSPQNHYEITKFTRDEKDRADLKKVAGDSNIGELFWDCGITDTKLIKSVNKMNIKDSFALAFKAEPEKSFRKAGITNGDDFLTTDGQHIFLSWLLKKHGEEFKKDVVDELLSEMEKKA